MASGVSFAIPIKSAPAVSIPDGHRVPHQNGTKRPHASLGDESDDEGTPSKQIVTHFDSKGAYNRAKPVKEKAPLVIKPQANRDWREAGKALQAEKRSKYGLPAGIVPQDSAQQEEQIRLLEESRKPTFGLNVKSLKDGPIPPTDEDVGTAPESRTEERKDRTDDERAMDALLGIKQQSDLTIAAASEEEAFQRDFREAPDMPTLEEYAAVPVEEFGAALLRGMGWREGHGIGKQAGQKLQKVKVPERRPALLGIGAKEEVAVKEEMGAWGRGVGRGKVPQVYNPVVMRNKKTGEELTEDEVKAKVQAQEFKDREAELDALHQRRKDEDRERRRRDKGVSKDELDDSEYERRKRDKRREKEKRDHYPNSRDRRRSRDRDDRRERDKDRRRDYRSDDRDYARRSERRDRSRDRSTDHSRRR